MKRLIALSLFAMLAGAAQAHEYKVGDLVIHHPNARQSPRAATVGAAFMVIENDGKNADRLVAATAENAGHVEIHEMSMVDGVMKMKELPKGLEIPAGGKVELKPGSYHLMLMDLKTPIAGENIKGSLTFEHAGKIDVEFVPEAKDASEHAH